MLTIFDGRPSLSIDAADVQTAIVSLIAVPEASKTYQEREDGHFDLTLGIDGNPIAEVRATGPQIVRASTSLAGVTLRDFPAGWSFGNGVTLGVIVPLSSGPRLMSWVIFPDSLVTAVNANFATLQILMET